MTVLGFNIPVSVEQWLTGAVWVVVGAATGVLMNGDVLDWRKAGATALMAFIAYCHNSTPRGYLK